MEQKKTIILHIMEILEEYTDSEHTLSQNDIVTILAEKYNLVCERKTVGRTLAALRKEGHEISSGRNGIALLSGRFEKSELRLLIDSVLASRYIDSKHSEDLIAKLMREGGKYFSESTHLAYNRKWDKTPNKEVFFTIEILDESIGREEKVHFTYNTYTLRKKLMPFGKNPVTVSPYFLLLHNQRYYLICNEDGKDTVSYFRVDRITDIVQEKKKVRPLSSVQNHEEISPEKLDSAFPYLIDGTAEKIVLRCNKCIFSDLVDWFGSRFTVLKSEGDYVEVSLMAPPKAMEYWGLQYGENAEILAPESLRKRMEIVVKKIALKYRS